MDQRLVIIKVGVEDSLMRLLPEAEGGIRRCDGNINIKVSKRDGGGQVAGVTASS